MSENKSVGNNPEYQTIRQEFFNACGREDGNVHLSNPTPSVERPPEVLLDILQAMEVKPLPNPQKR